MGTPDTVVVDCPQCNKDVAFQSKSGLNNMDTFKLKDAPEDVLRDVNRHAPVRCSCGARLVVIVSGINGRSVVEVK